MSINNKFVSQWRQWINRNKTFTSHEMDELENHILEEIDDLKQYEGLSEEEAFQKVVSVMGGREALDKEFVKMKTVGPKAVYWVKTHSLQIYSILILLIVLQASDLVYSSKHFIDTYEAINKNDKQQTLDSNSYTFMIPFSKIKPAGGTFSFVPVPSVDLSKPSKTFKCVTQHSQFVEIVFPENTFLADSVVITFNSQDYDIWEIKTSNKMTTKPLMYCEANVFNASYQFILDDKNQLWLEHYSKFTINSPKIIIKPQTLTKNKSILNKSSFYDWTNDLKNIPIPYSDYPASYDATKFLFFQPINSYQVLLFQKETDRVRTVRLQLIQFPNQKNPILVWDEVSLVHKPIHLWNKLKLSR